MERRRVKRKRMVKTRGRERKRKGKEEEGGKYLTIGVLGSEFEIVGIVEKKRDRQILKPTVLEVHP